MGLSNAPHRQCVLVFLKVPQKVRVKTRLAQVLDRTTVEALYQNFVCDLLDLLERGRRNVVLCFFPGHAQQQVREWLGNGYPLLPQRGNHLGERMANAFRDAFDSGFERVLLMGTDFPDLPADIIDEAFGRLPACDAVIGPAQDGGYYLIGFNSNTFVPSIFDDMAWGSATVFKNTLAVFEKNGSAFHVLPAWRDIDTYEDLLLFAANLHRGKSAAPRTVAFLKRLDLGPHGPGSAKNRTVKRRLSVIIPVLNEAGIINDLIDRLLGLDFDGDLEIIVSDGDARGTTVGGIDRPGVIAMTGSKGRGCQMNRGASAASGEVLLFLHADTFLSPDSLDLIFETLEREGVCGGAFDLGIRSDRTAFRLIEFAASVRSRLTRVPYGDQAIFIKKHFFDQIGGFKDIPIMEDVEFMQRIRKAGLKIGFVRRKAMTAPRRWQKEGIARCTLRNWTLRTLYHLGASPQKLSKFYRS